MFVPCSCIISLLIYQACWVALLFLRHLRFTVPLRATLHFDTQAWIHIDTDHRVRTHTYSVFMCVWVCLYFSPCELLAFFSLSILFTHCLSSLLFLFSCPVSPPSPTCTLHKSDILEKKENNRRHYSEEHTHTRKRKKKANRELAQLLIFAP